MDERGRGLLRGLWIPRSRPPTRPRHRPRSAIPPTPCPHPSSPGETRILCLPEQRPSRRSPHAISRRVAPNRERHRERNHERDREDPVAGIRPGRVRARESAGSRAPPDPAGARRPGQGGAGEVPRSSHAGWEPPADRRDPVELLEEQATSRVPELVPIRYGRMLASPFTFYRGAALIMAADLAATPRSGHPRPGLRRRAPVELRRVRLARAASWCSTSTTSTRRCPGPWEWDVKRLAASFAIAGREQRVLRRRAPRRRARRRSREYRDARCGQFAAMRNLDVWYARLDDRGAAARGSAQHARQAKTRKRLEKIVAKARTKDSMQAFEQADARRRRRAADRRATRR